MHLEVLKKEDWFGLHFWRLKDCNKVGAVVAFSNKKARERHK